MNRNYSVVLRLLTTFVLIVFSQNLKAQTLDFGTLDGMGVLDRAMSTAFDQDKNIIIAGRFGPNNSTAAFLSKYDSLGNLLWSHVYYAVSANSVVTDSQGNIIVVGFGTGSFDIDPGPADVQTNVSGSINEYPFIQKFDPNGNLLWYKFYYTSTDEWGGAVTVDNNDNVLWTFHSDGGFNFNVGGVDTLFTSQAFYQDIFVLKLTPSGDGIWCKQMSGNDWSRAWAVETDNNNNVVIGAMFRGTVDFDPNAGLFEVSAGTQTGLCMKLAESGSLDWMIRVPDSIQPGATYNDVHDISITNNDEIVGITDIDGGVSIFKLAANGSLIWSRKNDGEYSGLGTGIATDNAGNVFSCYEYQDSTDVNPGPGINMEYPYGNCGFNPTSQGLILQKLNASGDFVWARNMKSCGSSVHDIECFDDGSFAFNGIFSTGFDLTNLGGTELTAGGNADFLISRIFQDTCSNLSLSIDDFTSLNCSDSAYVYLSATGGVPPYQFGTSGQISTAFNIISESDPGILDITLEDSVGCQSQTKLLITAPTVPNGFDLDAHMVTDSYRPGFTTNVTLDGFSNGCDLVSGDLALTLDGLVSFVSSTPAPTQIVGNTLYWSFTNLNYDSLHITPSILLETSQSAVIGDTVCFDLSITPTQGDFDSSNNVKQYCFTVVNGYDPNDKKVYPAGKCHQNYIINSQLLTYTVRFQNTGNSEAINIKVVDSLSQFLDLNSSRILASSAPMYTEVDSYNTLLFHFDSILLPDSSVSFAESQGYVIFEISPYSGLTQGDEILNSADIYFDFNPPIITNETKNTIFIGDLTNYSCYTGIDEILELSHFEVYPNPTENIIQIKSKTLGPKSYRKTVTDANGRLIYPEVISNNNKGLVLDFSGQESGMYFIHIESESYTETVKIVKR